MFLRLAFLSTTYSVGQIILGLLVHPYQTLQFVVREKVFGWLVAFPFVLLCVLVAMWRLLFFPLFVDFAFFHSLFSQFFFAFLARWVLLFCVYWQILLAYLFFRFAAAFRGE